MTATALHATDRAKLAQILTAGVSAGSYWAINPSVNAYYEECVADEDQVPITLRLPVDVLENFQPQPDRPGLQEPLTSVLGMSDEEVWEAWEETDGSWQACAQLIGSFKVVQAIPAELIRAHNPGLCQAMGDEPPPPRPRM